MSARSDQLNEFARRQGYRNYYELRKARARAQGYSSLSEQRRARSQGVGLRGSDLSNPRYFSKAPPPPPTRVPEGNLQFLRDLEDDYRRKRISLLDPRSVTDRPLQIIHQRQAMLVDRQLRIAASPVFETQGPKFKEHLEEMLALNNAMAKESLKFFTSAGPLPGLYEEAARAVNPRYVMSGVDRDILENIMKTNQQNLLRAGQFGQHDIRRFLPGIKNRQQEINQRLTKRAKEEGTLELSKKGTTLDWARQNGVKAKIYSDGQKHIFSTYSELSMRAAATRVTNMAIIQASGAERFEVSDGPNCGFTHHNDSDKANGTIRTVEEVLGYPIAHPNCQRSLVPLGGLGPGRDRDRVKETIKAAAKAQAGLLAVDLASEGIRALANSSSVQRKVLEISSRFVPGAWGTKLEQFGRMMDAQRTAVAGIGDSKFSREALSEALSDHQYDLSEQVDAATRLRMFLAAEERRREVPLPKAVGDEFERFMEFRDRSQAAKLSVEDLSERERLEQLAFKTMGYFVGSIGPEYARFTFPKVGFRGRKAASGRFSFEPNKLINATITKTQRGVVNHLGFNKHGLVRAGISRDPVTGLWSPTFRLIPKGPIRIMARVNRSKGQRLLIENLGPSKGGRLTRPHPITSFEKIQDLTGSELVALNSLDVGEVTRLGDFLFEKVSPNEVLRGRGRVNSVSWEAKLVTKTPVNFSASFNLNLRKLGIHSWQDVRKLSIDDFQKLGMSDMRIVSLAAELRAKGWGPFQLSKTFRISWEDAQKLWEMTEQWVEVNSTNPTQIPKKIMEGIQSHVVDLQARKKREAFKIIYGYDKQELARKTARSERLRKLADFDHDLDFNLRSTYKGTGVVNLLEREGVELGETGAIIRSGPSYVTVHWESGNVVKYNWVTVNDRIRRFKRET